MSKKIFRSIVIFTVLILLSSVLKAEFPVRDGYIEFMGGKTWYKIVGSGHGIPLIVIHGGPAATHFYLEPLEALGDERPVIFYDQRGCGYSDPLDPSLWTVEFFTMELNQVIKQLGLKKYHIFGQSWGSQITTDFILTYKPKGLVSVIFSGPCLSIPRWANDQRMWLSQMPEDIKEIIYACEATGDYDSPEYQDAMMKYYKVHLCRVDLWPDVLWKTFECLNEDIYGYMWGPSEFTINGTLQNYDRTPDLHKIKVPTLFTCGEFDEAAPDTVEYYHRLVPGSEFVVFKNCSHETFLERPKQYNKEINKFLRKVEKECKR
jgi:proline iminopeptidase